MLSNDVILKTAERERLRREVEEFLAKGGKIKQAEPGFRAATEGITERSRAVRFNAGSMFSA